MLRVMGKSPIFFSTVNSRAKIFYSRGFGEEKYVRLQSFVHGKGSETFGNANIICCINTDFNTINVQ